MGKRVNWDKVSEFEEMIRAQGLKLSEGSKKFGIPLWQLYELNRRQKNEGSTEKVKQSIQAPTADEGELEA